MLADEESKFMIGGLVLDLVIDFRYLNNYFVVVSWGKIVYEVKFIVLFGCFYFVLKRVLKGVNDMGNVICWVPLITTSKSSETFDAVPYF